MDLGSVVFGGLVSAIFGILADSWKQRQGERSALARARWELRRDSYVRILRLLHALKHKADDDAMTRTEGREVPDLIPELSIEASIANLWMQKDALAAVTDAFKAMRDANAEKKANYPKLLGDEVLKAVKAIRNAARDDLKAYA